MKYRNPVLVILLLMLASGWSLTLPAIDSHGYWPLTHTSLEIQTISTMVAKSASEGHRIPSNAEELELLAQRHSERHSVQLPLDHWQNKFVYKVLNPHEQKFVVYSAGPDGIDDAGEGDDVVGGEKNYRCELYGSCLDAKDYANRAFSVSAGLVLLAWVFFLIRWTFEWVKRMRCIPGSDERPLVK